VFQRNTLPPASGLKCKSSKNPAEECGKLSFLLGLLFDPEGGGNAFLQNVGLCPNYIAIAIQKTVLFRAKNSGIVIEKM
jgi:hypothetical protein